MNWDQSNFELLKEHGFAKYKKNHYLKVENDIVRYLAFQGRKKNIHMWYSFLPFCLPEINLDKGYVGCAGGVPSNDEINLSKDISEETANNLLKNVVQTELPTLLKNTNTLEKLEQKYITATPYEKAFFPKAFCLFSLGDYTRARTYLSTYIDKYQKLLLPQEIENYNWFLDADNKEINILLEQEREYNKQNLKLGKTFFIK